MYITDDFDSAELLAGLTSSSQRVKSFDCVVVYNGNTVGTYSISAVFTGDNDERVKWTMDGTLTLVDQATTDTIAGYLAYGAELFPSVTIYYASTTCTVPLGAYTASTLSWETGGGVIQVEASDRMSRIVDANIADPYIVPRRRSRRDIVRDLAQSALPECLPSRFALGGDELIDSTTDAPITILEDRAGKIEELAALIGGELRIRRDGRPWLAESELSIATRDPTYATATVPNGGWNEKPHWFDRSEIYNAAVVTSPDAENVPAYRRVWLIENVPIEEWGTACPIPTYSQFGMRTIYLESDQAVTDSQADQFAETELPPLTKGIHKIDIMVAPTWVVDPGDILRLGATGTRYLVKRVSRSTVPDVEQLSLQSIDAAGWF